MIYFKDWIHLSLGSESHHEDVVLGLVHKEMRYSREEKHFNLQSVKLTFFFFFSSIKHVFRHFSCGARYEICLKLTIKTPEYIESTIKFKIKTPFTSFWYFYC